MTIKAIAASDALWDQVKEYARNCSWSAGKSLAELMDDNGFSDWERVLVALDEETICGFGTVTKSDGIPGVTYTPYVGYLFVDEAYRGHRLSQRLIAFAMEYLKLLGFHELYLVTSHVNLYEKYGFRMIDRRAVPWGGEESIFVQELP